MHFEKKRKGTQEKCIICGLMFGKPVNFIPLIFSKSWCCKIGKIKASMKMLQELLQKIKQRFQNNHHLQQPCAAMWHSLRQKNKLELSHMQYRCVVSFLQLFVEFDAIPGLSNNLISNKFGRKGSPFLPKKKVIWYQIWRIRRPCHATSYMHFIMKSKLHNHWNACSENQILQVINVEEHHLAWTGKHLNSHPNHYEMSQIHPEFQGTV